jgi:hypothetical protein
MNSEATTIDYAKKIVISLVKSPNYDSSVILDDELKEFFRNTRLFSKNDYFNLASLANSSIIF